MQFKTFFRFCYIGVNTGIIFGHIINGFFPINNYLFFQYPTRIVGCCASSTECSEHSLRKYNKVFSNYSFFFGVV